MNLPQELLDEIFSYLLSYDRRSLKSCSLVSKLWLEPSQRLLFTNIAIKVAARQSWLDNISPTNTALLRHVRSFAYSTQDNRALYYPPCSVDVLHRYLPSLSQLQTLALSNVNIGPVIPEHLEPFSAFQHTLSSLSLTRACVMWSAFVAFVGYFPNLTNLTISGTSFRVEDLPIPHIPHAWRGRLFIDLISSSDLKVPVGRFSELKLEYEEIEIYGSSSRCCCQEEPQVSENTAL